MKTTSTLALATLVAASLTGAAQAQNRAVTVGSLTVAIEMDRFGTMPVHPAIASEGRKGRTPVSFAHVAVEKGDYKMLVQNQGARRIFACVAIDGRNILNGEKVGRDYNELAAWQTPGKPTCYVVDRYSMQDFAGWRTDSATIRRFIFTSVENSAAVKYFDDPSAVGTMVISIFPEVIREVYAQPRSAEAPTRGGPSPRSLGTGAGESQRSEVRTVEFEPERQAAQAFVLHYATTAVLESMGVIPKVDGAFGRFGSRDCDRGSFTGIPNARPKC
ncbi:MAG: hypothetical protein KBE09_02050 [Candidatus Pacebacteria bacterium]|nr:hypothetical protein [Candidatus Paceibacterota bacterium]